MTNKPTSVDGAPQEEGAKKTVKKTRSVKKTTSSAAKKPARSPRKKQENAPATEQVVQPVVAQEQVINEVPEVKTEETPAPKAENPAQKVETPAEKPAEKQASKTENSAQKVETPAEKPAEKQAPKAEKPVEKPAEKQAPKVEKPAPKAEAQEQKERKPQPIPPLPNIVINDIVELTNAPKAGICLNDQQIQQLTIEEATRRFQYLEYTLANVLDYDVVLSDTNMWLELLVGHTSSHSDPRVNARLQFERQLEFISRLTKHRGGRFMMMSETYEEIDRFATAQEPTNYRDADWTDEALCRNVAARLAKRLILSQQRENRLRIECIGAESHHAAFADPAIIRRTVEMFAQGKKVLLLTNDASVGIRSLGMCDDLQRYNKIDDRTWDAVYAPLRPMVMTMDDMKVLDNYTRQYHFLQMAVGAQWMQDIPRIPAERKFGEEGMERKQLELWLEGFRPGDRRERNSDAQARQKEAERQKEQQRQKEAERQKEIERQKEQQRQQQRERDRQRQIELQKQREAEAAKQQEAAKAQQQEAAKAQQQEAAKQQQEAAKQQQETAKPQPEAEQQAAIEAPKPEVQTANPQPQAAEQQPQETEAQPSDAETQEEQPKKRPARRGGRGRSSSRGKKTTKQPTE